MKSVVKVMGLFGAPCSERILELVLVAGQIVSQNFEWQQLEYFGREASIYLLIVDCAKLKLKLNDREGSSVLVAVYSDDSIYVRGSVCILECIDEVYHICSYCLCRACEFSYSDVLSWGLL